MKNAKQYGIRQTILCVLIFLSLVSLNSCTSGKEYIYTEPEPCRPLDEIIAEYPKCDVLIDRALSMRNKSSIIEVLHCYDVTIQLLEDEYSICASPSRR